MKKIILLTILCFVLSGCGNETQIKDKESTVISLDDENIDFTVDDTLIEEESTINENISEINKDYNENEFTMTGQEFLDYCNTRLPYGYFEPGSMNRWSYSTQYVYQNDYVNVDIHIPTSSIEWKDAINEFEKTNEFTYYEENDLYTMYSVVDGDFCGYVLVRGNAVIVVSFYNSDEHSDAILSYILDNFDDFNYIVNYNDLNKLYEQQGNTWEDSYSTSESTIDIFEQYINETHINE